MRDAVAGLVRARPGEARRRLHAGAWTGPTSGLCLGHVQANLAVLPAEAADEFHEFCLANPRPLPLLDVTAPGDPAPRRVAPAADLRTDLPRYRVYRDGERVAEPIDVQDLWREDLVAFLLGCSFTAEARLQGAGVCLRHLALGGHVPMFVTSIRCTPAGRFRGPVVVSMRPIARSQLHVAEAITAEYPLAHGAPLHAGDPAAIGIADLARPDFGLPIDRCPTRCPCCGPAASRRRRSSRRVRPDFAITHAPATCSSPTFGTRTSGASRGRRRSSGAADPSSATAEGAAAPG